MNSEARVYSRANEYNQRAFNAGSVTDSIIMSAADWERAAKPARLPITEPVP